MKSALLVLLVACGQGGNATPDAAIDAGVDSAIDANTDPTLQVACGSNWADVADAPSGSATCAAACADHSAIGQGFACIKAHTAQYDGFKCTTGTATSWNGIVGCCLVQPDFAHVSTEPVVFAICD